MSSQLVDINADGHHDILAGSFCGVPQIIMGVEDGYAEPQSIMDEQGDTVLIANFWNYETREWDTTDRAGTEGHCTSVSAVDWDNDGDLDLLLGDYYGGRLVLRLNEGTAESPAFATTNEPILAGGEPLIVKDGLAAPRVVDWDGDGLFDILCGGSKGGVYLYANTGTAASPEFASAEVIIDPVEDPTGSFIRRVPAIDGQPTRPGSSYHIEPVDYDGDGDLDLLVGARSAWDAAPAAELTDEEKTRLQELIAEQLETRDALIARSQEAQTDEARRRLQQDEAYQGLLATYSELNRQIQALQPNPNEYGDFVWLYRRR